MTTETPVVTTTAPTTTAGALAASGATPPPVATPPAAGTTPAAGAADWTAGLDDGARGYVNTKGYKSAGDVVNAYQSLEKMIGVKERLVTVPEKFYDDKGELTPEGRGIYERLGAPKEVKDYTLPLPEKNGDPKLNEYFANVFHKEGIPKTQAEKVVKAWNDLQAKTMADMTEAAQQKFRDDSAAIDREWGAAKDQNMRIVKEAKNTLGISDAELDGMSATMGHKATLQLLYKISKGLGEDSFIRGNPGGERVLEPATARAQINELMQDKGFVAKINSGDSDSIAKLTRLHEMEAGGRTINL